eukprot:6235302-Amphidinium_carterae.1
MAQAISRRNIFKSPELMTEINDHTVDLTPERMAELDKERAQNILRADMEYILSRPQSIHLLNRFGFETVEIRLLFDILAHGADKVAANVQTSLMATSSRNLHTQNNMLHDPVICGWRNCNEQETQVPRNP